MGIQTTLVHPASGLNLASPHGGDVAARTDLYRRFADRITVNPAFTRRVVSYQDNKETPGLRWFRFKEGFSTRLVFAHPRLLTAHPGISLHYRGLCGLSQKRVQELATNVTKWEDGTVQRMDPNRCLKVARVYNTIISSIIVESTAWTMDNGYRTIMATPGMQLGGSLDNLIGIEAEQDVRQYLQDWLEAQGYIQSQNAEGTRFKLEGPLGTCPMLFGSEPDVEFLRDGRCIGTIEIKGGTDKAGDLERLGAIQKSFEETPSSAKNYLVGGWSPPHCVPG